MHKLIVSDKYEEHAHLMNQINQILYTQILIIVWMI